MSSEKIFEEFRKKLGSRYCIYPESLWKKGEISFFMVRGEKEKYLVRKRKRFEFLKLTHRNLMMLRSLFPSLSPSFSGGKSSFGFGDRLGISTPGHIRVAKNYDIFPVFAQQSIRENTRTGRSLQEVIDDALWGIFQEGYRGKFGADADHLKTIGDLKEAIDAGYTMFTVDPSDKIQNNVSNLDSLQKIKVVYGNVIKEVTKFYKFLMKHKRGKFEFEISVDETSIPTSPLAHLFIAKELHKNGVKFDSLALRFVGEFQKGIDYIGNINEFSRFLEVHYQVASENGNYKLSFHSGSDKFSIYPIIKDKTKGFFHLKTAGTSWLEAVRVISKKNPSLFRRMFSYALGKFEKDKFSYHITPDLSRIKNIEKIPGKRLGILLDKNESRQLLHVTFGSLLSDKSKGKFLFRKEIFNTLFNFEEEYCSTLVKRLERHLKLLI